MVILPRNGSGILIMMSPSLVHALDYLIIDWTRYWGMEH